MTMFASDLLMAVAVLLAIPVTMFCQSAMRDLRPTQARVKTWLTDQPPSPEFKITEQACKICMNIRSMRLAFCAVRWHIAAVR
jgi:hypothetical protein